MGEMPVFCGNIVDILRQVKLRPLPLVDSTTVRFKAVVLLLLSHCSSHCLCLFLFGPCFVAQYLVSFLVLLLCYMYKCLLGVVLLLVFCDTSTQCGGFVCSLIVAFQGRIQDFWKGGSYV